MGRFGFVIRITNKNDTLFLLKKLIMRTLNAMTTIKVFRASWDEFFKRTEDSDILDIKIINTKNILIDLITDFKSMFSEHVTNGNLLKLDKIQEEESEL